MSKNKCFLAPNGKNSQVYSKLMLDLENKDSAEEAILKVYSDSFIQEFGDWTINSDMASYSDEQTNEIFVGAFNNNFRLDVKTAEPKIYYFKGTDSENNIKISETYSKGDVPVFLNTNNLAKLDDKKNINYNNIKDNLDGVLNDDGSITIFNKNDLINATESDFNIQMSLIEFENDSFNSLLHKLNDAHKDLIIDNNSNNSILFTEDNKVRLNSNLINDETKASNVIGRLYINDVMSVPTINSIVKDNINEEDEVFNNLKSEVNRDYPDYNEDQVLKEILFRAVNSDNNLLPNLISLITDKVNSKYRFKYNGLNYNPNTNLKQFAGQFFEDLYDYGKVYGSKPDSKGKKKKKGKEEKSNTIKSSIENHINKMSFDDSIKKDEEGNIIYNQVTGLPEKNHIYIEKATGKRVEKSVSSVVKDYDEHIFDEDAFYYEKKTTEHVSYNTHFRVLDPEGNVDEIKTDEKIKDFLKNLKRGTLEEHFEKYPTDVKSSVEHLADNLQLAMKDWQARAMGGTKIHSLGEAIFKEDENKNKRDKEILTDLENRSKLLEEMELEFSSFKEFDLSVFNNLVQGLIDSVEKEMSLGNADPFTDENSKKEFRKYVENLMKQEFNKNLKPLLKDLDLSKLSNMLNTSYESYKEKFKKKFDTASVKFIKNVFEATVKKTGINMKNYYAPKGRGQRPISMPLYYIMQGNYNNIFSKYMKEDSYIRTANKFKEIKNTIKKRGGYIMTEVIVHTDKLIDINNNENKLTAGQIDVLAIYEDKESVNKDYRGTVEVYDFKTMKYKPADNKTYFNFNGKRNIFTGFSPSKKSTYATQLAFYNRILKAELGLTVKNSYLLPIYTPQININNQTFDYQYGPLNLNYTAAYNSSLINIREFNSVQEKIIDTNPETGKPIYEYNYGGYSLAERRARKRIPDNNENPSDDTVNLDKIIKRNRERSKTKMQKLVNDIKMAIRKSLDSLSTTEIDKSLRDKLYESYSTLEEIKDNVAALNGVLKYINDVHAILLGEDVGDEKVKGLKEKYLELAVTIDDSPENLQTHMDHLDRIRIQIESFDLLDKINSTLNDLSEEQKNTLDKSEDFKILREALDAKNYIKENIYEDIKKVLVKQLSEFASVNGNAELKRHLNSRRKRYNKKIEALEDNLKDLEPNSSKYESTKKKIKKFKNKIDYIQNEAKNISSDKESIARYMDQLPKDINLISMYLESPLNHSDKLLTLFMTMMKFHTNEAEAELKKDAVELEKVIEKVRENIGEGKTGLSNNPARFYDDILETRHKWHTVFNEETQEYERDLKPTLGLVDPVGTQKFTIDGKEYDLGYKEIQEYYRKKLRSLHKEGKVKDYRKLKNEFNDWTEDYMNRPYTREYYQLESILSDESKKALEEIDNQIQDFYDGIRNDGKSTLVLTDSDRYTLKSLLAERKQLSSFHDANGDYKNVNSKEFKIAEELQEYNKKKFEIYESGINYKKYNAAYKEARRLYADNPVKMLEWESENNTTKYTDKFYFKYRRLKLEYKMTFFANYNDDQKVKDFLYDGTIITLSDENWLKEAENVLGESKVEKVQKVFNKTELGDLFDKMSDLLKPYRTNGEVDMSILPAKVTKEVKAITNRIKDLKDNPRSEKMNKKEWEKLNAAIEASSAIKEEMNEFADYVPTTDYWIEYYKNKEEAENLNINYTETEWFVKNHLWEGKKYEPYTFWKKLQPLSLSKDINNVYKIDRESEIQRLQSLYPNKNKQAILEELKKTKWYLSYHNNDGSPNDVFKLVYMRPKDDNLYVVTKPSPKYNRKQVKKEYINKEAYDEFDNLTPKKSKWENKKGMSKVNKSPLKPLYDQVVELYMKDQQTLPQHQRMGYTLPFITKDVKETLAEEEGLYNKAKGTLNRFKEHFLFTDLIDESDEIGDTTKAGISIDNRTLPMPFTSSYGLIPNEVSKDVVSSIMQFSALSKRRDKLGSMFSTARSLLSVVKQRDLEGKGTLLTDSKGKNFLNSMAKKMGIERFQKKEGISNATELLNEILKMHFFNEYRNVEQIGKFRVDKLLDRITGLASATQIGGLNTLGLLKGANNWLQAELQVFIESMSNDSFTKKAWREAQKRFITMNVMSNAMKDFGKTTKMTLTGQLQDYYDPLQGDFVDRFGKKVSQTALNDLFSSETWYLNQYAGEFKVAMNTMFAMLAMHKIVDGEVYSKTEWLNKKRKELNKAEDESLSNKEVMEAEVEFDNIKHSLLDAYEINEDGHLQVGKINGKKVNWEIGSKRDIKMKQKLHSVSRQMQGNYSKAGSPLAQKSILGRLFLMYRKYLEPAYRKRVGKLRVNEEEDKLEAGYYRTFLDILVNDTVDFIRYMTFRLSDEDNNFSEREMKNLKKANYELLTFLLLTLLVTALRPGEDEETDEISGLRWALIYLSAKLRKEVGSLTLSPTIINDNIQLLSSPFALGGYALQAGSLINQMLNPFETYETKYGDRPAEANKLWWKFKKLIPDLEIPLIDFNLSQSKIKRATQFYLNLAE